MSNFIISLGTINKKYSLILIYIICYVFFNLFLVDDTTTEISYYIGGFGYSIGEILSFFIATKIKYHRITNKNKDKSRKRFIKGYLILLVIDFFYLIRENAYIYLLNNNIQDYSLYINEGIEIILLTLITYFLLKYKYYIHHLISIAILVLLCIIIDLILDNFSKATYFYTLESVFYVLMDSLIFSYIKYLMEYKYFYFMDIIFTFGMFEFLFCFILFA